MLFGWREEILDRLLKCVKGEASAKNAKVAALNCIFFNNQISRVVY